MEAVGGDYGSIEDIEVWCAGVGKWREGYRLSAFVDENAGAWGEGCGEGGQWVGVAIQHCTQSVDKGGAYGLWGTWDKQAERTVERVEECVSSAKRHETDCGCNVGTVER